MMEKSMYNVMQCLNPLQKERCGKYLTIIRLTFLKQWTRLGSVETEGQGGRGCIRTWKLPDCLNMGALCAIHGGANFKIW